MSHPGIVIIGAGPAGLCAAISAGRALGTKASEVLLLEANPEAGKKLLLTGSGQCNYTNSLPTGDFLKRCHEYKNYLKPAFYGFNNAALMDLLQEADCQPWVREDGKVFPAGLQAAEVRDAFLTLLRQAGVQLKYSAKVVSVSRNADLGFTLKLQDGTTIVCARLIIATGGASYPQTGSDGSGAELAVQLGHSLVPFRTALGNVDLHNYKGFAECAGVSLPNLTVTFVSANQKHKAQGDLLFTHSGFSGPVILDNCHRINPGEEISLCLQRDTAAYLASLKGKGNKQNLLNALQAKGLPRSVLSVLLARLGVDASQPLETFGKKAINLIDNTLQDFRFKVARIQPLSTAMASAGGIPLAEINSRTMQSRLCAGLFFAGELMDYALPTGGFNIQIACSTGWLAGLSAAKLEQI